MDKYNVIDKIDNLQDLENDMFEWSRLPIEFKQHADDECIRRHGMKVLPYYELIKAKLLRGCSQGELLDDTMTAVKESYNGIEYDEDKYKTSQMIQK